MSSVFDRIRIPNVSLLQSIAMNESNGLNYSSKNLTHLQRAREISNFVENHLGVRFGEYAFVANYTNINSNLMNSFVDSSNEGIFGSFSIKEAMDDRLNKFSIVSNIYLDLILEHDSHFNDGDIIDWVYEKYSQVPRYNDREKLSFRGHIRNSLNRMMTNGYVTFDINRVGSKLQYKNVMVTHWVDSPSCDEDNEPRYSPNQVTTFKGDVITDDTYKHLKFFVSTVKKTLDGTLDDNTAMFAIKGYVNHNFSSDTSYDNVLKA